MDGWKEEVFFLLIFEVTVITPEGKEFLAFFIAGKRVEQEIHEQVDITKTIMRAP